MTNNNSKMSLSVTMGFPSELKLPSAPVCGVSSDSHKASSIDSLMAAISLMLAVSK